MRHCSILLLLQFLLYQCQANLPFLNKQNHIDDVKKDESLLSKWMTYRCGPGGKAVWIYKGGLFDPLDGRKIAAVEGLEFIRRLSSSESGSFSDYVRRCGDLQAPQQLLEQFTMAPLKNAEASTVLCRKLFCYQDNDEQLMKSFRLRPQSPLRRIPQEQAVTLFETATTYLSPKTNSTKWLVHSEWPNHSSLWGTTSPITSNLEFTVFCRRRKQWDLPTLLGNLTSSSSSGLPPPRSTLIQFGSSEQQSIEHRMGARESYSLSSDNIQYRRYGEGPPFYGPGRLCTLELQGTRLPLDDVVDLPSVPWWRQFIPSWLVEGDQGVLAPTVSWRERLQSEHPLLASLCTASDFFQGMDGLLENDEDALDAVDAFRNRPVVLPSHEEPSRLQLLASRVRNACCLKPL